MLTNKKLKFIWNIEEKFVLLDDWDEINDTVKIDHKFFTMDHKKNLLESHQLP